MYVYGSDDWYFSTWQWSMSLEFHWQLSNWVGPLNSYIVWYINIYSFFWLTLWVTNQGTKADEYPYYFISETHTNMFHLYLWFSELRCKLLSKGSWLNQSQETQYSNPILIAFWKKELTRKFSLEYTYLTLVLRHCTTSNVCRNIEVAVPGKLLLIFHLYLCI